MITPEQRAALPSSKPFTDSLQALVEGVNGFVYAGDRLDTIMDTVCWLRDHPDAAFWLLTPDRDPGEDAR